MTRVSKKNTLSPETRHALNRQLLALLAYPKTARAREKLIEQFFTTEECIVFQKRIALILMIDAGVSSGEIISTLNISESTLARFTCDIHAGKFKSIRSALANVHKSKDATRAFLNMALFGKHSMKARWGIVNRERKISAAQYGID